uniref:Uncharacterized protein n=1 Tax=Triticum urartu TaxID=4572 RepID=A0A8R7P686_TRIUA
MPYSLPSQISTFHPCYNPISVCSFYLEKVASQEHPRGGEGEQGVKWLDRGCWCCGTVAGVGRRRWVAGEAREAPWCEGHGGASRWAAGEAHGRQQCLGRLQRR